MKSVKFTVNFYQFFRRSREGAWIEILMIGTASTNMHCRSREGAWIEIFKVPEGVTKVTVAPVRERGLKCRRIVDGGILALSRSREGAWIEIHPKYTQKYKNQCRSREGAWIEIAVAAGKTLYTGWSLP